MQFHPGYRAEQARAHLWFARANQHGVDPRPLLEEGRLPTNMAVFGIDEDGEPCSYCGGEPPVPPRDARR